MISGCYKEGPCRLSSSQAQRGDTKYAWLSGKMCGRRDRPHLVMAPAKHGGLIYVGGTANVQVYLSPGFSTLSTY